jgi:galactitol-specific phosphotransferase system IIB component
MIISYLKGKLKILFFCAVFLCIAFAVLLPYSNSVRSSVMKEANIIKSKMSAVLVDRVAVDIKNADIIFIFKKFKREYSYTTKKRTGRYVYEIIKDNNHQEFIVDWEGEGKDIEIVSIYARQNGKSIEIYNLNFLPKKL